MLGAVLVHSANVIDARELMLALRAYGPTRVDVAAVTVDVLDW